MIETIRSGGKFQCLQCCIDYEGDNEEELLDWEKGDDEQIFGFAGLLNWKSLDDALGDEGRFPGKGPSFWIGLSNHLLNDAVTRGIIWRQMPKLTAKDNLDFDHF